MNTRLLRLGSLGIVTTAAVLASLLSGGTGHAEPERGQTRRLFNGKDLTNFYTWMAGTGPGTGRDDKNQVFSVVDQIDGAPAIRVSGNGYGGFTTNEEFENYHLVAEFRWGLATWGGRKGATKDSGILVHCQGEDGNTGKDFKGPWMMSQECQIIEGGVGDFIMVGGYDRAGNFNTPKLTTTYRKDRDGETVYDPKGEEKTFQGGRINWWGRDPDWKDVLGFRGKEDVESPSGEWTRVEVICDGDTITNVVNGKVVNKGWGSTLTKGKILFQTEGAEIYFRKIEITPLRK